MLKLTISDLLTYVLIILQYVTLCYSVVRESSVTLNLLLDETNTVFSSGT
jgi:hypothetical protein